VTTFTHIIVMLFDRGGGGRGDERDACQSVSGNICV